jgi:transposase
VSGIPLVTVITPASISDQNVIMPLIEKFTARYPNLTYSYILLDKGHDTDEIHHDIYELFVIIRGKMVYPKGFTKDGFPLCPW